MFTVKNLKSDNLQYNMVGRQDDGMIVPPSDGPMFILIDWESCKKKFKNNNNDLK